MKRLSNQGNSSLKMKVGKSVKEIDSNKIRGSLQTKLNKTVAIESQPDSKLT